MGIFRWLAASLLLVLLPVSGCAGGCTDIGCDTGVNFELDQPLEAGQEFSARACVDDICREAFGRVPDRGCVTDSDLAVCGPNSSGSDVQLTLPEGTYDDIYDVRLELMSASGDVLVDVTSSVSFERSQPNGPTCPPVCWNATVSASTI